MKERIILVMMKLEVKPKYKGDKKCIEEGLKKMVTLV